MGYHKVVEASASAQINSYSCEAFRVCWGVNTGEDVRAKNPPCLGDHYRLSPTAGATRDTGMLRFSDVWVLISETGELLNIARGQTLSGAQVFCATAKIDPALTYQLIAIAPEDIALDQVLVSARRFARSQDTDALGSIGYRPKSLTASNNLTAPGSARPGDTPTFTFPLL
ncbi:MAG: hypothetical protein AAGA12_11600 [Pseudomonadota bacterium]